jgi:hypothetical protein
MSFQACTWSFRVQWQVNGQLWTEDGSIAAGNLAVAETAGRDTGGGDVVLKSQFGTQSAFSGTRIIRWAEGNTSTLSLSQLNRPYDLEIHFDDQAMVERMRSAFSHSIQLCGGGKKEAF